MKIVSVVGLLALAVALSGCNSYNVRAIPRDEGLKSVVVINNSRVRVADFEDVLTDAFKDHGISVRYEQDGYAVKEDEYAVTYSALQSWDFVLYLTDANVRVRKGSRLIGSGNYHHNGTNMSMDIFTKWRGTKWKMQSLYDQLLENY